MICIEGARLRLINVNLFYPCFSRTQFLPNPTILEWEISSKSPNVLLEDLEVNLWINLGLFAIAMPRIRLFVGDIWSHCPSLYSDFQPTLGAVKRSDLGRFREGKVDEPTPKMKVWRENLWCFSRWIPQSYYVNLMKSDELYIVCSSSIWNNGPQLTFMFLRWIKGY